MYMATLDKDSLARPELWRLVIMIGPRTMDVVLYPPVAREEIVWHRFDLDPAAPTPLKAIEDIIYENPLLLSNYRKIDCIIDSPRRVMVPCDATAEQAELFLSATIAKEPASESILHSDTGCDARMIQSVDAEILPFLKRTFYNASFHGKLSLLTNYFANHTENSGSIKIRALVRDSKLTFIALQNNHLLAANDFNYQSVTDAAYYLLASMKNLCIEPTCPELDFAIHGESLTATGTLTEILRRYVPSIKAIPFPTLRFRASKSTLQIPFPMLILPICE